MVSGRLATALAASWQMALLLGTGAVAEPAPPARWSYSYTTNPAANTRGGIQPGATYTDNHLFGLQIPYKGLLGTGKGTINLSFLDRNGQSLSAKDVGNQFTVQQIYGGQTLIYYALNATLELEPLNTTLRLGRMSTGDVFATDPIYWLYMNNAICGNPQSLIVNTLSGFSAYPTATWGGTITSAFNRSTALHLGVFQVADVNVSETHGLDWGINANDGVFLIAQLDLNRQRNSNASRHIADVTKAIIPVGSGLRSYPMEKPTQEKIETNAFTGVFLSLQPQQGFGSAADAASVYGFYLHVDRQIYRERPNSHQGLTAWASASLVPQETVAKMPGQANAGLIYTGLFPSRDNDLSMLGVFAGRFSKDYLGTTPAAAQTPLHGMPGYELVIEVDHRFVLSPSTYIQPNVQIVVNPGGTGSRSTALVVGAQAGISF